MNFQQQSQLLNAIDNVSIIIAQVNAMIADVKKFIKEDMDKQMQAQQQPQPEQQPTETK